MLLDHHQLISEILQQVDMATRAFVFDGYSHFVQGAKPLLISAMVLYVTLIGVAILQGWAELTIADATRHTLKIIIIFSLATQWDIFSFYVYGVFTNGPNELSMKLLGAVNNQHTISPYSVQQALQAAFDQGMDLGSKTWQRGGISNFSFYFYAIAIWIITLIIIGLFLLEIVAAKLVLAILLVTAPIFLIFLMWPKTQGIFENWLRYVIGYALVPLFVIATFMFILILLQATLGAMNESIIQHDYTFSTVAPYLVCGIVSIGLVIRISSLAVLIGGGFSIEVVKESMNKIKEWTYRNNNTHSNANRNGSEFKETSFNSMTDYYPITINGKDKKTLNKL